MERWTGAIKIYLDHYKTKPLFTVAASLLISSSSNSLTVPSVNAIFFNGDRVEGTGNSVIDRLSDGRTIARLIASKFGLESTNAWVITAASFNGPFAVYNEFVPSVNSYGEPEKYDPEGFPAATAVSAILEKCMEEVNKEILSSSGSAVSNMSFPLPAASHSLPRTVVLGFSKGGIVINQIVTELANLSSSSSGYGQHDGSSLTETSQVVKYIICPTSKESLLSSISEFHYVDVGLNRAGAYLTEQKIIMKLAKRLSNRDVFLRIALHGTPRQWCDKYRQWIQAEKDKMLHYLRECSRVCEGKLQVIEKFYFANEAPTLQMHFEVIEKLDMS